MSQAIPTLEPGVELTTADVAGQQCPICGGPFAVEAIEELIRVGNDTAIVPVQAIVCQQCGYHLLDGVNTSKLDAAYRRLECHEGVEAVGTTYRLS